MNAAEATEALREAGDLTERQAEAFVLREFEGLPRGSAADRMGVSVSTFDSHHGVAKKKVRAVRETADLLDRLHGFEPGDRRGAECADCGAALGGRWVETDDGRQLCPPCGVE